MTARSSHRTATRPCGTPRLPPILRAAPHGVALHSQRSSFSPPVFTMPQLRAYCSQLGPRQLCVPVSFEREHVRVLDGVIGHRIRFAAGERLYRREESFRALFIVKFGSLKTCVEQKGKGSTAVVGVHLADDVVGFDGVGGGRHAFDAIALEVGEALVLPLEQWPTLAQCCVSLPRDGCGFLARQLARGAEALLQADMHAVARVAAFLLSYGERHRRLGYSGTHFVLRLSRSDIATYLGLRLETVSRQFSRLHKEGLIDVKGRAIRLLDVEALRRRVASTP